jgi:ADP-ribose pyrophosphatase YjhB (NUDIX family)
MTSLVCFRDNRREVLLYKRRKEPYYGMVTLPNGKLHYGEYVGNAADRELHEKTGLKADLKHIGIVYLNFINEGDSVNHTLSHVFLADEPQGDLNYEEGLNEPFWHVLDSIEELELLEGTKEILDFINKPPAWFTELAFNVSGKDR